MSASENTSPHELPAPSAEQLLLRSFMEALLATQTRKRSERLLRKMADLLAEQANLSSVLVLRPTAEQLSYRRARQQAAELFERHLPVLLARLPPE